MGKVVDRRERIGKSGENGRIDVGVGKRCQLVKNLAIGGLESARCGRNVGRRKQGLWRGG